MPEVASEKKIRFYPNGDHRLTVELDPPASKWLLENVVLKWILDDPIQRRFIRYAPDENGDIYCVEHELGWQRSNLRSREDIEDYYKEMARDYQIE